MKPLHDMLTDADPLRAEPEWPADRREAARRAILATPAVHPRGHRARRWGVAGVALAIIASAGVGLFGPRFALAAAVHFEARLAEEHPGPGLVEATVAGSTRAIYLHAESILSNGDIRSARVVEGPDGYDVVVLFTPEGAERMRRATEHHVNRPLAILLDGRVVTAPTVRSPIGESAVIQGDMTRDEAERIAVGIQQ